MVEAPRQSIEPPRPSMDPHAPRPSIDIAATPQTTFDQSQQPLADMSSMLQPNDTTLQPINTTMPEVSFLVYFYVRSTILPTVCTTREVLLQKVLYV